MSAIEYQKLIDSGKLVETTSQIPKTKGCGEYWVKTGDTVVVHEGRAYRRIDYNAYDCKGYLVSGAILIPLLKD